MADEETQVTEVQDNPESESPAQSVTVEDIGPARKRLRIEVPQDRISEKVSSSFTRLRSEADVPGFRRGRVPMRLIEKRFGTSVRDDVRMQLITESYTQAIESENLDVIGEPDVKDLEKIELPEDGALSFEVEVEVSPDVELPDLTAIEINKPVTEVTEKDIDAEIDQQRERFGKYVTIDKEGAEIEPGHVIGTHMRIVPGEGDATAEAGSGDGDPEGGEPIDENPDVMVYVPGEAQEHKGPVAGIIVEDLGKKLVGQKIGDSVSISMTGPPGHENEKIKNQPITIELKIQDIRKSEPCPIEDLVQYWGFESPDALRERITQILKERNKKQQKSAMHDQVRKYLIENVDLELPEGLTTRQTARILQRRAMEMAYQGLGRQEIEQQIAELRAGSEEEARRQLKQHFILDQAAKNLEVEVTEGELNGRIAMIALQQNRRPEKLKQEMRRNGEIESLYMMFREEKTLDMILESAKITGDKGDAPPEPETVVNPDPDPESDPGPDDTPDPSEKE